MKIPFAIISICLCTYSYSQNIDFPDIVFKENLIDHTPPIDTNNDNEISIDEAEALTTLKLVKLNATSDEIFNLEGIQFFKNLTSIEISRHPIDIFDPSLFQNLKSLILDSDSLLNINVNENILLTELILSGDIIQTLDVTKNVNLKSFAIGGTNIEEIDINNNKDITRLVLNDTKISEVNLSNQINLDTLILKCSKITEVDLSKNLKLEVLWIAGSDFTNIDISNNVNLKEFDSSFNFNFSNVDFSNNPDLRSIYLRINNLNSLDISKNPKLEQLIFFDNNIDSIDLSNSPNLINFSGSGNMLKQVDFSLCPNIEGIDLVSNNLERLIIVNTNLDIPNGRLNIESNYGSLNYICADQEDSMAISNLLSFLYYSGVTVSDECPDAYSNLINSTNNETANYIPLKIFPNPAYEYITIDCQEEIHSIEIINENAQVVKKTETNQSTFNSLNISTLESGFYFIRAYTRNGLLTKKLYVL